MDLLNNIHTFLVISSKDNRLGFMRLFCFKQLAVKLQQVTQPSCGG